MAGSDNRNPFRIPAIDHRLLCWSPFLRLAHDYRIPAGQRLYARDAIGDHALHYFHTGAGTYELDGKSYPITARSVFLVRPGHGYRFDLKPEAEVRMFNLHFDLVETPQSHCPFPCPVEHAAIQTALPADLPGGQRLNHYPAYEQVFFQLLDAAGSNTFAARLNTKALLLSIIALLYADSCSEHRPRTEIAHSQAVEKVLEHFRRHHDLNMSIDAMAAMAGVSRALFCRIFRDHTGLTPQKYLQRLRIEQATVEMQYGDTPIKEIAVRCGFADVHHFSRVFKNLTGSTPARYRADSII